MGRNIVHHAIVGPRPMSNLTNVIAVEVWDLKSVGPLRVMKKSRGVCCNAGVVGGSYRQPGHDVASSEKWNGHRFRIDCIWDDDSFGGERVGILRWDWMMRVDGDGDSVEMDDDKGFVSNGGSTANTMDLNSLACAGPEVVSKGKR